MEQRCVSLGKQCWPLTVSSERLILRLPASSSANDYIWSNPIRQFSGKGETRPQVIFLIYARKHNVVSAHWKRLAETLPMIPTTFVFRKNLGRYRHFSVKNGVLSVSVRTACRYYKYWRLLN